jgi:hypothetical protein
MPFAMFNVPRGTRNIDSRWILSINHQFVTPASVQCPPVYRRRHAACSGLSRSDGVTAPGRLTTNIRAGSLVTSSMVRGFCNRNCSCKNNWTIDWGDPDDNSLTSEPNPPIVSIPADLHVARCWPELPQLGLARELRTWFFGWTPTNVPARTLRHLFCTQIHAMHSTSSLL